ncbi:CCCH zinc finger domain protein [Talaromyces stipitatus ATCC 10500]|uniref:CCCH zinc finger domain protein n=1 Tax=Talaromyces stipitatus (strain ATCC 10500 / CBS 375.48 / QM 6759 / NRRL 1006) TaxID=441959 RepID=B8MIA8_TALSN|nr:CCCH zinc finger domain protein [Talaromyces stipitatus ATCC 10500]EED14592.1 CCCH zinc finger domain protein [Talaromyces stipitatus ATCC 10500]
MTVCVHFQQGRCRYGDRCRNEHPGQVTSSAAANRFSVLGSNPLSAANNGSNQQQQDKSASFHVTAEGIQLDLTLGKERPGWIFSAYGPGKNAPRQLFGGPSREQSFEEMRLRHYESAAAGNVNMAVQEAQKLHDETVNQIQTILNDLKGAVKYVLDGQNEHPNRIDIIEGKSPALSSFVQRPSAVSSTPAFGQASSSIGSSIQGAPTAAFGQASVLGQSQPTFGRPSGLGTSAAGTSFGTPPRLEAAQPALGKPAFGQPSFGQPAFGQPSAMGGSGFASAAAGPSPFSQATQPNPLAGGNFGQSSTFGQGAQSQLTSSPFSQIGNQATATSTLGQPSSTSATFGQSSQTVSPFAQQQRPSTTNPFAQTTSISATPSVFGKPTATAAPPPSVVPQPQANPAIKAPLGPKPIIKVGPEELNPIPDLAGDTVRDARTNQLIRWKGRAVEYKDGSPRYLHPADNKTWVRIFFFDGPPDLATLRDCSDKEENYTADVTEQYQYFIQNGVFKDGIVPTVPPKTGWVSFDF